MATLLLKHADLLATFDDADREIVDGGLFCADGVIRQVGATADLPQQADQVIDARHLVVMPGLINTHHHFYQTLTRNTPLAQNANLFTWLKVHYPIWARMDAEAIAASTQTAIAELMLSGCTTASDHTYIWPNGARIDDQIEAARAMGIRFHASRGSMSVGESQGGLPPDSVVEDEAFILRDSRRVIEEYHDPKPYSMLRIVLAPCSPFSVSPNLMRESIALARAYGVHSHTHLAETLDEATYCTATFGQTPVELAEDLGWVGQDVWHAHMVHPSTAEVERLGHTHTGATHCPSSNMRLASGIAPVRAMLSSGMRVGLGVDGSASNDGSHLLAEARLAMLLQRVGGNPAALSAREALRLATQGGAAVLGRPDIGRLAPGMAADIVGFRTDTIAMAGAAIHDPLAALVFTQPANVDLNIINGIVRVQAGQLLGVDIRALVARHNTAARRIMQG